jgi:exo-1,4-beta-D-glucosaminidase
MSLSVLRDESAEMLGQPLCLNADWRIQSSARLAQTGPQLSTPNADTTHWYAADLPATVLGTLVDCGEYPDPFVGDNLRRIPGQGPPAQNFSNHPMPDDSPFRSSWWYRKRFRVPAELPPHLSLQLDGLNYRANVWLNGHLVADARRLAGAYRVHELDVTRLLRRDELNALAIEVLPPRPCDLAITWVDWNPSPPDKNMGLWRDAWLCASGPVAVRAPFVSSYFAPDGRVALTVAGDLVNTTDEPQRALVSAEIEDRTVTRAFALAPRERRRFALDDCPELTFDKPRLWWPRFMGDPALHELHLRVQVGGRASDAARIPFGIREVGCELTEGGHALFRVNGEPVLIRGAGWATDLFLRRQPERDRAQLEYLLAMNLNTIRFEGMVERAEVLEWCDREGVMVIAGWCCCDSWEKWHQWTDECHHVTAESLRSQVRRVRRHPCMISWFYGSDFPPPEPVERRYLAVLDEEGWPNPAHSSAANRPTELTGKSGMKMEGPYDWVPPNYWLEDRKRGGAFGFATEICPGAAVPPIESLRKMLPPDHLWPIDEVWNFHAGGQEFHNIDAFAEAIARRYGECATVEEFAQLAQLATYEAQRAMFEAYTRNKFVSTGVIHWMLGNAWPSLIWHLFDYYLRPGGGFFGTQKGCEPLHVMYSYDDRSVVVTNEHAQSFAGLRVFARVLDLELRERFAQTAAVDVAAGERVPALLIPEIDDLPSVYFVDLRLATSDGALASRNFYWLPRSLDALDHEHSNWMRTPVTTFGDLRALRALPRADVILRVEDDGRVELTNPSEQLAFFVQLRLCDVAGQDVLPVVWSDNYLSLLPGETREVSLRMLDEGTGRALFVEASGLNVPPRRRPCR